MKKTTNKPKPTKPVLNQWAAVTLCEDDQINTASRFFATKQEAIDFVMNEGDGGGYVIVKRVGIVRLTYTEDKA